MAGALIEGLGLWRRARRSDRRTIDLGRFAPPTTPIVRAAGAHLRARSGPVMVNHCYRTAYWTITVLHQNAEVTPTILETAWVAALLHDVGLDDPPARGDFSMGGVEVVRALAREHGWPDEQAQSAGEAIAANLCARVSPARSGAIAWAMNVGGLGELGFPLHRAQMAPGALAELEARYPRAGLRATSRRLIAAEAARLPRGRFAFFRYVFPFITKD